MNRETEQKNSVAIVRVDNLPGIDERSLRETLSSTVVDPETNEPFDDEIQAIIDRIKGAHGGDPGYVYYIALIGDAIRGVMGMRRVGGEQDPMRKFAEGNAVEVINASVHREAPKVGIGTMLLGAIHDEASKSCADVVVVNSGPRYQKTGWPFWKKHYGEPSGLAEDLYGPGTHAPVWVKYLQDKND